MKKMNNDEFHANIGGTHEDQEQAFQSVVYDLEHAGIKCQNVGPNHWLFAGGALYPTDFDGVLATIHKSATKKESDAAKPILENNPHVAYVDNGSRVMVNGRGAVLIKFADEYPD